MREIPVPVFKHSDLNIFFLIFRYIPILVASPLFLQRKYTVFRYNDFDYIYKFQYKI